MYVKDMPITSRPDELPVYANDMSVRATSHHPTLLIIYLEIYPNALQRWLWQVGEGHQCPHEYRGALS
jgi:hypothetical protein